MINTPKILDDIRNHEGAVGSGWSLKRKLFSYMLLLVCLLLLVLVTGMFLLGQFNSTEQDTFDALDMQMEVFEKDIINHFDSIAAAGVNLSKNMTVFLENYLQLHELSFAELSDNGERITELPVKQKDPCLRYRAG